MRIRDGTLQKSEDDEDEGSRVPPNGPVVWQRDRGGG